MLIPPVADLQITLRFVRLVAECDDTAALREFRTANPNESLASGKVLCERVRASRAAGGRRSMTKPKFDQEFSGAAVVEDGARASSTNWRVARRTRI